MSDRDIHICDRMVHRDGGLGSGRVVGVDPVMPAVVVFDCGEAHLYGRSFDGRVDYDRDLPWPADWPQYITGRFCRVHGIPWTTA